MREKLFKLDYKTVITKQHPKEAIRNTNKIWEAYVRNKHYYMLPNLS
jgi:hypothetical protein